MSRYTGSILFTADIDCDETAGTSIKLGLAVKWAVKSGAYLGGAYLGGAYLGGAYLGGAYLGGAYLGGAYLGGAKGSDTARLPHFQIPQEGALIGWKKLSNGTICKLQIPAKAARTATPLGRKCRAKYVKVLAGEGVSGHDYRTEYKKGQIVRPDKYDPNPLVECTNGIHFFLTREEAEEY
jgi:hypothetical protein